MNDKYKAISDEDRRRIHDMVSKMETTPRPPTLDDRISLVRGVLPDIVFGTKGYEAVLAFDAILARLFAETTRAEKAERAFDCGAEDRASARHPDGRLCAACREAKLTDDLDYAANALRDLKRAIDPSAPGPIVYIPEWCDRIRGERGARERFEQTLDSILDDLATTRIDVLKKSNHKIECTVKFVSLGSAGYMLDPPCTCGLVDRQKAAHERLTASLAARQGGIKLDTEEKK